MRRGWITVISGLCLIILSLYYLIFFKNPPSGLFAVLLNAFGFTIIITGIFQSNDYYNKKVYFSLITAILVIMLVLSILLVYTPEFGDIITGIILIIIFTVLIIWMAYKIDKKMEISTD